MSELNTKMYGHYEILSRSIFPCHVQTSLRPSNSDSSCRFLGRTLQDGSTSAGGTTEEARTIERPTSYIASSDVELKAACRLPFPVIASNLCHHWQPHSARLSKANRKSSRSKAT